MGKPRGKDTRENHVLLGSEYYVDMRDMDHTLTETGVTHVMIDPLEERGIQMPHCFVASERVDDVARDAYERMIQFLKDQNVLR